MTVADPLSSAQPSDAIVVGAGRAGLVATHELVQAGRSVLVIDQENRRNLGGQAFWSGGGCIFSGRAAGRATARQLGAAARERVSPA